MAIGEDDGIGHMQTSSTIPYRPMMGTSQTPESPASNLVTTIHINHPVNETPNNRQGCFRRVCFGTPVFDVLLCVIILACLTYISHAGLEPYRRGFFCGDQSIRYPYKKEQLSSQQCSVIATLMAILTIIVAEMYRRFRLNRTLEVFTVKRFFRNCFSHFGCFIFGVMIVNYFFVFIMKLAVGRLRPNFLAVCRPNISLSPCQDPYAYITDYICQNDSKEMVIYARLSFFSGHASLIMGSAVFCVIYLQARISRFVCGVIVLPVIQAILIAISLLIAFSRISDYRHHWSDVLVGILFGCFSGYYTAVIMADVYGNRRTGRSRRLSEDSRRSPRPLTSSSSFGHPMDHSAPPPPPLEPNDTSTLQI